MPFHLTVTNLNHFSGSTNDLGLNPDGSAVNPEAFQRQIRSDSNLLAQLFQVNWSCSYSKVLFGFSYGSQSL